MRINHLKQACSLHICIKILNFLLIMQPFRASLSDHFSLCESHIMCSVRLRILFFSLSICDQKVLMMAEYKSGWAARAANEPNDEIIKSGRIHRFAGTVGH
jgi:hypothetical protein